LQALPKVEFKINHKSTIINRFHKRFVEETSDIHVRNIYLTQFGIRRNFSGVAKPSLFIRLAKVAFREDDESTKVTTPFFEKNQAHIITANVVFGKDPKLNITIPTGISEYLKERFAVSQDSAPLSPLLFASKLLPRKQTSSSIVPPRFHLDELQKTHPTTAEFIVVSSTQLASYTALLDQWLWRPDYPQNHIVVFLVSVSSGDADISKGWMNPGRSWEIGKLLLEHLNFCEYAQNVSSLLFILKFHVFLLVVHS
jgi:hypothetical protein